MTYNGAAAATKEDIRKTLDSEPQSAEEINQSYKSLTQPLTGR
jgi:serine protease inhibitor